LKAIARAVEVNSPYLTGEHRRFSASCFSPRKQKQEEADRREDDCSGEADGRNLGAGLIIFFKLRGEANQETKKTNAEHNQPDRSLVICRDFHGCGNQI
jgi:hypothetical protein